MKWEANVRQVVPYIPGEQPSQPDMIKLNTNECPYPPAPGVKEVLENFDVSKLRLYPDPKVSLLVKALADANGLDAEQVFVGVGSDDVLAVAFLTFFNSGQPILFPDITYSFYDVWAGLYRIPFERMPLDEHFRIRKEDYKIPNGGIVLANPNAPTGELESLADIEEILQANQDVIVIIDEAYIDFGGISALPLIEKYDNLLVVQTFSKSRAMAGIRIGYAMGNKTLISYLSQVKFSINSYTMNMPSIVIGVEVLQNDAYFREIVAKMITTREEFKAQLREMGFLFGDSRTNFIFATHPEFTAKELYEALRGQQIYVRHFQTPRIDNYLRISIGTDEEMAAVCKVLRAYMQK